MKCEIKKDWEHIHAPKNSNGKHIYKKGETVNVNLAEYQSGIKSGFIVDPNAPKIVEKPKKEKATSKFDKQTR